MRIENVRDPQDYVGALLERVKEDYIRKAYNIAEWTSADDFLERAARRLGRLLKVTTWGRVACGDAPTGTLVTAGGRERCCHRYVGHCRWEGTMLSQVRWSLPLGGNDAPTSSLVTVTGREQ